MAATEGPEIARARSAPRHDIRTCPACGQMSFDVMGVPDGCVYCEFCGAEIAIAALVKTP
jgi:hypothetical protein